MKGLVFGAEGQLGRELVRLFGPGSGRSRQEVSVTDASAVERTVAEIRPDVVFNCAAYDRVDEAERQVAAAQSINSDGPFNLAFACRRHGARMVHFSTNYVFDGLLGRAYVERDAPNPASVYARTKLEGELRVLEALPQSLVIRTAALYGGSLGRSFPERILERAHGGQPVRVVTDQTVNPTLATHLAAAAQDLAVSGTSGIVHAVSDGCCSWYDFAQAIAAELGQPIEVLPILSADLAVAAKRPLGGCLRSERIEALPHWRTGLREWAARWREARHRT